MSRVDFYILSNGVNTDYVTCSIVAKAWSQGNRVHIHTSSQQVTNLIDDMLWTFRDISFIPHTIFDTTDHDVAPVTISHGSDYPLQSQVIINLDDKIPDFISYFDRVAEIVNADKNNRQLARQRYRQYRDNHFEIYNHNIDKLNE